MSAESSTLAVGRWEVPDSAATASGCSFGQGLGRGRGGLKP
jgi:hypothetical protein